MVLNFLLGCAAGIVVGYALHLAWLERPGRAARTKARRIRTGFAAYRRNRDLNDPFDISPQVDDFEPPIVTPPAELAPSPALVRTSGAHAKIDADAGPEADLIVVGRATVVAPRDDSGEPAAAAVDDQADTRVIVTGASLLRMPGYLDNCDTSEPAVETPLSTDEFLRSISLDPNAKATSGKPVEPLIVAPPKPIVPALFDDAARNEHGEPIGSWWVTRSTVDVDEPSTAVDLPLVPADAVELPIIAAAATPVDAEPTSISAVIPAPAGRQRVTTGSKRKGRRRG